MAFKMKYPITIQHLPVGTKRRSGIKMDRVGFLVAHDTGNPGSTASGNVGFYKRSANDISASAHMFIDDNDIIECIPTGLEELFKVPEKAWHVLYDKPLDNQIYGDDANDIALGFEYCYGPKINADEAYKRYIWVMAYACYKYGLDASKSVIGHFVLDPQRKTDPKSGLHASGRTYEQMLRDVAIEYNNCIEEDEDMDINKMEIYVDGKKVSISNILYNGNTHVAIRPLLDSGAKTIQKVDGNKIYLLTK